MPGAMTAGIAKEWQARWELVAEAERRERATTTIDDRWRRLNALYDLAAALGFTSRDDSDDEMEAYQQWAILKTRWMASRASHYVAS
ncbi:MAG: hypothetical protein WBV59_06645 [Anaerolineae bacterium]